MRGILQFRPKTVGRQTFRFLPFAQFIHLLMLHLVDPLPQQKLACRQFESLGEGDVQFPCNTDYEASRVASDEFFKSVSLSVSVATPRLFSLKKV